jgi:hypothetical protein
MVATLMEPMDVFSDMDRLIARQIASKLASTTVLATATPSQAWSSPHSVSVTTLSTTVAYQLQIRQIVIWLVLAIPLRCVVQEIG